MTQSPVDLRFLSFFALKKLLYCEHFQIYLNVKRVRNFVFSNGRLDNSD